MWFALILLLALQDARPVNLREMSLRHGAATKPVPEYPRASVVKKTTGVAVVDIGTRDDFKRAHLDGAVNIPVDELSVRGGIELPAGKPVAIDCTRDEKWRCEAAASSLGQRGFTVSIVLR